MEEAMDSLSSDFEFRVRWEPYLLRSQIPPEGMPFPPGYGDPNNPRTQYLRGVASSLGLEFNLNRKKFSNTVMGHALMEYAKNVDGGEKQDMVSEKLFKHCFTDAEDLQLDSCLAVARECGLDEQSAKEFILNPDNLKAVVNKAMSWSEKGISGVPTFYMNGHKMFSGAQEPDVFKRMFEIAAEKRQEKPNSKQ
ncbi:hypothetical protein MAR_013270 [Mya arenaria]|uniref:DSBA-like thioredoxin domain-containing protein n=1 Tax=Mya arenaria TaxID=6604 RepID=A0ABY7G8H8_MYAAR|nr:hypothetical protein MAR_013270 [Mya arenaria]